MKRIIHNLLSYVIFLITVTVVVSIGILIYSSVKDFKTPLLAILVLLYILFTALVFFIIDYIRRNIIIKNPLNDIFDATYLISKGDFNINLEPRHKYDNFDELDKVMVNINKMANALKNEEILKENFISNFSHEIKTPIAVISGYIDLLKKDINNDERNLYLEKLYVASNNLSTLVSNILKLNKLDNTEIIEFDDVNLSMLLENVIVGFVEMINNKNIDLDLEIDDKLIKNTNESFVQIIFSNLISNAIKFSNDNSSILIKLKEDNNRIKFIVKDNGIGMNESTVKSIFNRFYQGDTSHKMEGNGLGLSMVKKAIDRLEYKISIESEEGVGSTFIVEIK